MAVSVVVPFAGDCEHRARALAWTRQRYEQFGWEVVVGQGDAEEWRKADAVTDALERAAGDTLVVADCDVWSNEIEPAVHAVERGAPWVVPFRQVYRLNRASTEKIYEGDEFSARLLRARPPYRGVIGGGIIVLTRELYGRVPLDRRFVGWGGEDLSWGYALRTLAGEPVRLGAHLWHLWHPPQVRPSEQRRWNAGNTALYRRYAKARSNPDLMLELVKEATCPHPESTSTTAPSAKS